jgi:hypothetical protein
MLWGFRHLFVTSTPLGWRLFSALPFVLTVYKNCLLLWPRLNKTLWTATTEFIVAIKRERSVACNEFLLEETIISTWVDANLVPHQKFHRVQWQGCGLELSQVFVVTGCTSSGVSLGIEWFCLTSCFTSTLGYCPGHKWTGCVYNADTNRREALPFMFFGIAKTEAAKLNPG